MAQDKILKAASDASTGAGAESSSSLPSWRDQADLCVRGPLPVWRFCHAVVCPLEVELGPQRLPWLLLLLLRNAGIVPGWLLCKRFGAGEGGRNSAHLHDRGRLEQGQVALLGGRSQVTSGRPTVPMPREHGAAEGADILSGLVEFLEYLPG